MDSIPEVKCFPITVVKEIVKDLISGDSAKALLKTTETELIKCEEKSYFLDSVKQKHLSKIENLNGIISDERVKYGVLEEHTKNVENALGREKFIGKCTRWVSGSVILILGVIITIIK
jgi:hypothetical protein